MGPSAEVIADSISEDGHRVTTMLVTMHRFVLAEFNTHRVFSRNSASSRAIPVDVIMQRAWDNPAWPVSYPCERPGMSGGEELTDHDLNDAFGVLADIQNFTVNRILRYLNTHPEKGNRLHKSLLNRPMEWFGWHTVVVTSTEWDNFFGLRCHPAAQPEMRAAAELMMAAYNESTPTELGEGMWHAPFLDDLATETWLPDEGEQVGVLEAALKTSAARCAWVSTMKYGKEATWADVESIYTTLTKGLTTGEPIHASPFEHQCTPTRNRHIEGNLRGWAQLRHMIERNEEPWAGEVTR